MTETQQQPAMAPVPEWIQGRGRNVYSQCGEDGYLAAIFERLGPSLTGTRWCCEVGAGDGLFCSNTRWLIEQGWHAVLIERDPEKYVKLANIYAGNPRVHCVQADVVEDSIDAILTRLGVASLDLLVIDVDGPDYYVFNSLLQFRPSVVLIEYNVESADDYLPTLPEALASDANVPGGLVQAGVMALQNLAWSKLYRPLIRTARNLVCVTSDCGLYEMPTIEAPEEVAVVAEPLRLNLGSGTDHLEGYVNLDISDGHLAYPLTQYGTGTVDEVRASHVLEHYSHRMINQVVAEWVRVLKPGGLLKVAVPNFAMLDHAYRTGQPCNLQGILMGGQVDDNDVHRCAFDPPLLRAVLRDAGLREITTWRDSETDCSSFQISLNLCGVKWEVPQGAIGRDVMAVMTAPRVCWTDPAFSIIEACMRLGMSIERMHGAFWNQCIEQLIMRHAAHRFILTIDYDTVFTPADVENLYAIMDRHPEVDALFGVQMKRENDIGLFVRRNEDGSVMREIPREDMHAPLMRCASGHFGLTMIRTEALKRMGPHPWFIGEPDKDGNWSEESVDADITFWRKWHEAGNTLYQANHVLLGHLQLVVTWPDENLQCIQQYVSKYNEDGRPPRAWLGG